MNRNAADRRLAEIEESQTQMRESIEETKRLSQRSDALLRRHRQDAGRDGKD